MDGAEAVSYTHLTFDDYNTSLKMTKECVAEKPLIAYQCKTGFLKRFLELSYNPDPAETVSYTHLDVYKRQEPSFRSLFVISS